MVCLGDPSSVPTTWCVPRRTCLCVSDLLLHPSDELNTNATCQAICQVGLGSITGTFPIDQFLWCLSSRSFASGVPFRLTKNLTQVAPSFRKIQVRSTVVFQGSDDGSWIVKGLKVKAGIVTQLSFMQSFEA